MHRVSLLIRRADVLEPRLLPKDETAGLTSSIRATVTAMFQMNRVAEAPADVDDAGRSSHFTAGLSGALEHLEALTAILRHLRHERQPFEMPVFVECRKDLLFAPDFDPVPCSQRHGHALSAANWRLSR